MTDGHRKVGREAELAALERGALDGRTAERIGTIENDDLDTRPSRLFEQVTDGCGIGVKTRADILKVNHQRIDTAQHRRCWTLRLAVQGEHRQTAACVDAGGHCCIEIAAQTVLGTEQRHQGYARRPGDQLDGGFATACDGCLMREQAHSLADQRFEVFAAQHVDTAQRQARGGV